MIVLERQAAVCESVRKTVEGGPFIFGGPGTSLPGAGFLLRECSHAVPNQPLATIHPRLNVFLPELGLYTTCGIDLGVFQCSLQRSKRTRSAGFPGLSSRLTVWSAARRPIARLARRDTHAYQRRQTMFKAALNARLTYNNSTSSFAPA
jgi:hypothetical protein